MICVELSMISNIKPLQNTDKAFKDTSTSFHEDMHGRERLCQAWDWAVLTCHISLETWQGQSPSLHLAEGENMSEKLKNVSEIVPAEVSELHLKEVLDPFHSFLCPGFIWPFIPKWNIGVI
jgi:hypothetical protein